MKNEEETEDGIWYFAIASMINPISLRARDINPLVSFPAKIIDYSLRFRGTFGMAEAVSCKGSSFHGVVHKLSHADMAKLDAIEAAYNRKMAIVELYSGEKLDGWVYCSKEGVDGLPGGGEDSPPYQRYIEIIVEGCKHFGVDKEYIEHLQSLKSVPRKKPEEFKSFPVPPDVPKWTLQDVAKGDGKRDNPAYVTINGKVLQYKGPRDTFFGKMVLNTFVGGPFEPRYARNLYDPKYGIPQSLEEFKREHCAYIEDLIATHSFDLATVVAVIDQTYAD